VIPGYPAFKRCRATGARRRSSKAAEPRSSSASLGRTEPPPLAEPGGRPAAACACACDVAENHKKRLPEPEAQGQTLSWAHRRAAAQAAFAMSCAFASSASGTSNFATLRVAECFIFKFAPQNPLAGLAAQEACGSPRELEDGLAAALALRRRRLLQGVVDVRQGDKDVAETTCGDSVLLQVGVHE